MRSLMLVLAVAACSGDPPKPPDGGYRCTGAVYDTCLTEHDCGNGFCRPTGMLMICTQGCTPGDNSCPMQNGQKVTCDAQGLCEPPAANMCHL